VPATKAIRPRERDTIIQALTAGVVPRLGLPHIQVGRANEIQAMVRDIDRVADGGAAVRFIIGEYGAGKTFFASVIRLIALEKKCVTMHADLSPHRRIYGSNGQGRALYAEAVANMATRNKPEGGALQSIVERLVTDAVTEAAQRKVAVEAVIDEKLLPVCDLSGGHDFATVLKAYWRGSEDSNQDLKNASIRWLRGEYSTRTEAKNDLGVRTIIDDSNVYISLKSLACLVRIAGYAGLLVMFDEMANLYKLQNLQARKQNYDEVLTILNDALQGTASGIGVIMCGTPEFLSDTRRGLFSYDALQTRLAENSFAVGGRIDYSGPVIRLQSLTPVDLLLLLEKIRLVFAGGEESKGLVPDEALTAFMDHCQRKIGAAYFQTPRSTIRAFVHMLAVLEQNPGTRWQDLLEEIPIVKDAPDTGEGEMGSDGDDELSTLRLGA
jgi:hypothetical protein